MTKRHNKYKFVWSPWECCPRDGTETDNYTEWNWSASKWGILTHIKATNERTKHIAHIYKTDCTHILLGCNLLRLLWMFCCSINALINIILGWLCMILAKRLRINGNYNTEQLDAECRCSQSWIKGETIKSKCNEGMGEMYRACIHKYFRTTKALQKQSLLLAVEFRTTLFVRLYPRAVGSISVGPLPLHSTACVCVCLCL